VSETLLYKPDWPETKRRWAAFWAGERLDRPCMMVTAPREGPPLPPFPEDPERRWTDLDFLIEYDEAYHASRWYLGETVPRAGNLLMSWCAAYGARAEFRPDTIWIEPCFNSWEETPDFEKDWDNEGWRRLKRSLKVILEHARGRYFVGMPPMLPPNDVLPNLRGVNEFLMDLVEQADEIQRVLKIMRANFIRMYDELEELLDARSLGYGSWWTFWSPDRFYAPQSDISCMLSSEMFETFIVPELEELCSAWTNVFYHLDGPGALHHLDRLLQLDGIDGIQWVPGSGRPHGWAAWRDLYVKISEGGKRAWVPCGAAEVEEVIKAIPPERLLISTGVAGKEDGEELLKQAVKWTARHWPATRKA